MVFIVIKSHTNVTSLYYVTNIIKQTALKWHYTRY